MGKHAMRFEKGQTYTGLLVLKVLDRKLKMVEWNYRVRCGCGAESVLAHRTMVERMRFETRYCRSCHNRRPSALLKKIEQAKKKRRRLYRKCIVEALNASVCSKGPWLAPYTIIKPPAIITGWGYAPYLCDPQDKAPPVDVDSYQPGDIGKAMGVIKKITAASAAEVVTEVLNAGDREYLDRWGKA